MKLDRLTRPTDVRPNQPADSVRNGTPAPWEADGLTRRSLNAIKRRRTE